MENNILEELKQKIREYEEEYVRNEKEKIDSLIKQAENDLKEKEKAENSYNEDVKKKISEFEDELKVLNEKKDELNCGLLNVKEKVKNGEISKEKIREVNEELEETEKEINDLKMRVKYCHLVLKWLELVKEEHIFSSFLVKHQHQSSKIECLNNLISHYKTNGREDGELSEKIKELISDSVECSRILHLEYLSKANQLREKASDGLQELAFTDIIKEYNNLNEKYLKLAESDIYDKEYFEINSNDKEKENYFENGKKIFEKLKDRKNKLRKMELNLKDIKITIPPIPKNVESIENLHCDLINLRKAMIKYENQYHDELHLHTMKLYDKFYNKIINEEVNLLEKSKISSKEAISSFNSFYQLFLDNDFIDPLTDNIPSIQESIKSLNELQLKCRWRYDIELQAVKDHFEENYKNKYETGLKAYYLERSRLLNEVSSYIVKVTQETLKIESAYFQIVKIQQFLIETGWKTISFSILKDIMEKMPTEEQETVKESQYNKLLFELTMKVRNGVAFLEKYKISVNESQNLLMSLKSNWMKVTIDVSQFTEDLFYAQIFDLMMYANDMCDAHISLCQNLITEEERLYDPFKKILLKFQSDPFDITFYEVMTHPLPLIPIEYERVNPVEHGATAQNLAQVAPVAPLSPKGDSSLTKSLKFDTPPIGLSLLFNRIFWHIETFQYFHHNLFDIIYSDLSSITKDRMNLLENCYKFCDDEIKVLLGAFAYKLKNGLVSKEDRLVLNEKLKLHEEKMVSCYESYFDSYESRLFLYSSKSLNSICGKKCVEEFNIILNEMKNINKSYKKYLKNHPNIITPEIVERIYYHLMMLSNEREDLCKTLGEESDKLINDLVEKKNKIENEIKELENIDDQLFKELKNLKHTKNAIEGINKRFTNLEETTTSTLKNEKTGCFQSKAKKNSYPILGKIWNKKSISIKGYI